MTKARDNASQGGLVLLNKTDFSAVASVSVDNVFTSTYQNYKLILNINALSGTNPDINWYGRTGGSDVTSNYSFQYMYARDTSVGAGQASTARFASGDTSVATTTQVEAFLANPQLAQATVMTDLTWGPQSSGNPYVQAMASRHTGTNQFDGIKVYPTTGTFTGTVRIYGIK